jgi:hypothetical protein
MARITEMPAFMLTPVWIWDLDQQVGWGYANRRDDVMLVQVALNRVMKQLGLVDTRKKGNIGPMGPEYPDLALLKTDGKLGTETQNAIIAYQRLTGSSDGLVDPVHPLLKNISGDPTGGQLMSWMKIQQRTMYRLAKDHLRIHGRMMTENDFPPELRGTVARASAAGG